MGLEHWQSEIDKRIQEMLAEAEREGVIEQGKRLVLDDDGNTPDDRRMAFKIMRDNDMVPEWIMMGKDLDKAEAALRSSLARAVATYRTGLFKAERAGVDRLRDHAEKRWRKAKLDLTEEVHTYNDRVLTYNLKVPSGIAHRPLVDLVREIDREMAK